jgi:spore coat polysaccharide biosynthesis protein SpsF (cytidylyltransferase family)
MPTVGALIPVRSGSSRLPGKPLADVAGRSALERVAARAAACRAVERVVIATTRDPSDDALAAHAAALGLGVYRGPVDDVLGRLAEAAAAHRFDVVVEVDGDDLLCAPEYMERGVEVLEREGADLVQFTGLPVGATPNVLSAPALARAVELKDYQDTSTGFFRFLVESGHFRVVCPRVDDPAHQHATARMTLDYPEDLAFFRAVYAELDRMQAPGFGELVALLHRRPDLVALNQGLDAAYRAHFEAGLRR